MKNGIGASLPDDLWNWFNEVGPMFPGGKSGLIKESLRAYKDANPNLAKKKDDA